MKETLSPVNSLKWLATGVLLINLFIITLAGISIRQSRLQYEERAAITTRNLSQVLDEYISGVISKTDMALLSVVDEAEKELTSGGVKRQALNTYIVRQHARITELDGLRVTNAKGDIIYGTDLVPGTPVNIADRDYFIYPRDDSKSGVFISKPLVSRVSGKETIVFARRFNYPDGPFAGVVSGRITLENFARTFSRINVGKHGAITIFDSERSVICRYPEPQGTGSAIGIKLISAEILRLFERNQTSATYSARGRFDHVERIYSYRKISAYPLYVMVGLAKDDYLAEWRKETVKMSAFAASFFLVTLCSAWLLYLYIIARKQTEEKIKNLNEDLERRISERTAELESINMKLQDEIAEHKRTEEKLLETTQRFQLVTASGQLGIWDWDVKSDIMVWNDRMFELYGVSRESFPKCVKAWENGLHPDDHAKAMEDAQAALRGEKEFDTEFRVMHPDGTVKVLKANAIVIRDAEGKAIRMLGLNRDITKRKNLEAEIQKKTEELDTIFNAIPATVWYKDTKNHFIRVNKAAADLIGLKETEINGRSAYDIFPAHEAEKYFKADLEVIQSGAPKMGIIETVTLATGELRWINTDIIPQRDEKGTISGIVVIAMDITELNRAQEALQKAHDELERRVDERTLEISKATELLLKSEKKLKDITSFLAEGIYVLNEQGNIIFMNPEAERLLGWSMTELTNKRAHDVVHYRKADGSLLPFEECNMFNVMKTGVPFVSRDEVFIQKDGTAFPISVVTSPILQNGKVVAVVTAFRDITERKRIEDKLEAANKELEAFSYSVSHDLRAPLRHASGFVKLLQKRLKDNPDEKIQHYGAMIEEASKRMERLIDDLLAFSRIGRSEMQKRKVGFNALVREVAREIQDETKPTAGAHAGRDIVWEIDELPEVYGDQSLLRLALVNLISNAVKYTGTRTRPEIKIGYKDEGNEFIFFVKDNGVGFDMKYVDRLFGVFQRLHTQDEFEGTGIGLANVRRIISRHSGRTWAEASVGQGAIFYFTLPKTELILKSVPE